MKNTKRKVYLSKMNTEIEQIMQYKENPLTGNWLCWIPGTAQAYYSDTKTAAKCFCEKVNNAFNKGELKIIDGKVIKIKN